MTKTLLTIGLLLIAVSAGAVDLAAFAPPVRNFHLQSTANVIKSDGVAAATISLVDEQGAAYGSTVTLQVNTKTVPNVVFPQTVTASMPGVWTIQIIDGGTGMRGNTINIAATPTGN